ncbi:MAG: zinc-dependent peptidase [Planctomycetaceae bacterium]|nr:zinc-dependent peptidase [Planctomycetaceae bacterium]
MWHWWKTRRRRKQRSLPFPAEWEDCLTIDFADWHRIEETERQFIREYLQVFIREKNWEGCGGLEITERVKVLISAQVGLMVLGLTDCYFDHVLSILVYPDAYRAPNSIKNQMGIIDDRGSARMGEAWWQGPVILSWRHSLDGARNLDSENLVCHEFAHQIDMLNGRFVDGTPPLESEEDYRQWSQTMTEGYEELKRRFRTGQPSVLRRYALTNPAEFFAVSTEVFFASPEKLLEDYPDVYRTLQKFYGQDPCSRRSPRSDRIRA